MEAGTSARRQNLLPAGPAPSSPVGRLARNVAAPVSGGLAEAGRMAAFVGQAAGQLGGVWRYSSEVLRQAGILVVGSAVVIFAMEFVIGLQCGLEANYVLRGYGATIYSGVFTAYCSVREMTPMMFGYIISAKIGCGLVAEIGSMRINEEIDAMESLGINPMRYVVATRIVAMWLVIPIFFLGGLAFTFLSEYLVIVVQIKEVSSGGWSTLHWGFISPYDVGASLLKFYGIGTFVTLVGCYYGYFARGGPTGVGAATARSMILNLVGIHVINMAFTMIFWGLDPKSPIGG
jgi:phospholipid/cholesterol/gamma-HCH transport system permease protein